MNKTLAKHTKWPLFHLICDVHVIIFVELQLTFNEESVSHLAVAFIILGQAGVPSGHSGLFYHQGAPALCETNNDGVITEDSGRKDKSAWD